MTVFEKAISSFAREFKTGDLKPGTIPWTLVEHKRQAEEHIAFLRKTYPRLPPIHFGFTDLGQINACVFRFNGEYVIAVNVGTAAVLSFFFCRVLADRELLSAIGDPDRERNDLPNLSVLMPNAELMIEEIVRLVTPRDQERIDFSHGLLHRALRFLLAHELTHILNGHVDYLNASGSTKLFELNSSKQNSETLDRQVMEVDADVGATSEGMYTLLARLAPIPERDPKVSNSEFLNPSEAFFFWFFAVQALFRFFGDDRFSLDELRFRSYPPFRMRQLIVASNGAGFVEQKSRRPDLGNACRESSRSALTEVEKAFARLLKSGWKIDGLNDAVQHLPEHSKQLRRHWRESLRARLLKFSYVNLSE